MRDKFSQADKSHPFIFVDILFYSLITSYTITYGLIYSMIRSFLPLQLNTRVKIMSSKRISEYTKKNIFDYFDECDFPMLFSVFT